MSYAPYQPPQYAVNPNFNPYGPPRKPVVLVWYIVYCILMALLYLMCIGMGGLFFIFSEEIADKEASPLEWQIMGAVCAVIGAPLFLLYAVGPFLPRNKFGWIVGLVHIGIGLTSGCTLIPCIFLLLGWLHAETKNYYGMK